MIDQSTLHDESHKAVLVKSCRKHVRSIFNNLVARVLFFFFLFFFFFYVSALVTKRPPTILFMTNEQRNCVFDHNRQKRLWTAWIKNFILLSVTWYLRLWLGGSRMIIIMMMMMKICTANDQSVTMKYLHLIRWCNELFAQIFCELRSNFPSPVVMS